MMSITVRYLCLECLEITVGIQKVFMIMKRMAFNMLCPVNTYGLMVMNT